MNPILIDMNAAGDLPARYQAALDEEKLAVEQAAAIARTGPRELAMAAAERMFAAHERAMQIRGEMMQFQIKE